MSESSIKSLLKTAIARAVYDSGFGNRENTLRNFLKGILEGDGVSVLYVKCYHPKRDGLKKDLSNDFHDAYIVFLVEDYCTKQGKENLDLIVDLMKEIGSDRNFGIDFTITIAVPSVVVDTAEANLVG